MGLCGKCDFQDTVDIFGADKIIKKYKIYIGDEFLPLRVESEKDLVPYYPYLISIMASEKDKGGVIRLHNKSFIDEEEEEHLGWYLRDAKKYWRKCKRKHQEFDESVAYDKINIFGVERPYLREIIRRVAKYGNNAIVNDLHDTFHDRMRNEWYQLMIEAGWPEEESYIWVYGWSRWLTERRKNDEECNKE